MKKRTLNCICAALLLFLAAALPCFAAPIEDTVIDFSRVGAVNVAAKDKNGDPLAVGSAVLIPVADVTNRDGKNVFVYKDAFTALGETVSSADLDDVQTLQKKLVSIADPDGSGAAKLPLDKSGRAHFFNVKPGMYLLMHTDLPEGATPFIPAVVTMPYTAEDGTARYELSVIPKPGDIIDPIRLVIRAQKKIVTTKGSVPQDETFTFRLMPELSYAPMPEGMEKEADGSVLVTRKGEGDVDFGPFRFSADDVGKTYRYTVSEVPGDNSRYSYDRMSYAVNVSVRAEDGKVMLDMICIASDNRPVTSIEFINRYTPGKDPEPPEEPDEPDNPPDNPPSPPDEPDKPEDPGEDIDEPDVPEVVFPDDEDGPNGPDNPAGGDDMEVVDDDESTYDNDRYNADIPLTGQSWIPVWALASLGLLAVLAGFKVRKERAKGAVLMLAVILILGAAGWTGYNVWDSHRAGKASEAVLKGLAASDAGVQRVEADLPDEFLPMPIEELDGVSYIGVLDIPGMGISLPVAENWNSEQLEQTPCRFSGSYKTGDLVICGHNYADHFGPVRGASSGETVILRTVDGAVYCYTITNIEKMQPSETQRMVEGDDWDLTLFTCTAGAYSRIAIRCELESFTVSGIQ
ncbi:MAG: sortase [Firmicutes bacterium]|nr:sortase [Bacillota bacterium]